MEPLPDLSPNTAASAPVPIFPTAALGPVLEAAATVLAARTQAPLILAAHHLLTLAAMAAQRAVGVRLPTGALRPVSCFFLTLAGAGEGRGAVVKAAVEPLRQDAGLAAAARGQSLFKEPVPPRASDRYCSLQTQSALFTERGADLVASGRARVIEAASLSSLWNGRVEFGPFTGKPNHPRLSLHLVAAPRDGAGLLGDPDLADGGLLGRLLAAAPASCIGTRLWAPASNDNPPAEIEAFHALVKNLLLRESTAHGRALTFTEAAASQWFAFAQDVENNMREEGAFAAIRPLAGHLAEHAARLAAVIALIEDDAVSQLDERHLARGVELARFYAAEALRISAIVPVMKTPAEITQQLQHWLERKHADRAVTLREICRSGPPSVRDADLAYRHMRRLERLGVVHQTAFVPETAGDTRRPGASQAWHVGQPTSPANSPCPSRGVA